MVALSRIALTYAAFAVAFVALVVKNDPVRLSLSKPTWRPPARAAWTTAWLTWLPVLSVSGLIEIIAPAAWVFAFGVAQTKLRPIAVIGASFTVIDLAYRLGLLESVVAALAMLLGAAITHAMRRKSALVLRLLTHWASFVGTFAFGLPLLLDDQAMQLGFVRADHQVLISIAFALIGVTLALAATTSFARKGEGTPEPSDPPRHLVTHGLFAVIRHPIQLAEISFVIAGVAWWPSLLTLVYAVAFTVALVGPMRRREERALAETFGDAYEVWRRSVPAYLPTWSSRR